MTVLNLMLTLIAFMLFAYVAYLSKKLHAIKSKYESANEKLAEEISKEKVFANELGKLQEKLQQNILSDELTHLPSKQVFEDRFNQAMHQASRYQLLFGIMFVDLDDFKTINDALGYDIGDQLLKQVAARLQDVLRQVDTVTRFAGDKFVLLLPQIAKQESCAFIAKRILDSIAIPYRINEQQLFLTASIGVAVYPNDGESYQFLLKAADTALNQAKARGSNGYDFYHEKMRELTQRQLKLNSSLHEASVYDEFTIYYQPIVNTKTKSIVCMEALLRWQHPELGLVTPEEFLKLAEQNNKIVEIGERVLQMACKQFQEWQRNHFHVEQLAVNVSLKQLENPHFSFQVSQILKNLEMNPASLILEVTDGVFHRAELLNKSLQMLSQIGVKIAVDDLGTGSLSFKELRNFPINYLKVDGVLVREITHKPESESIVKMISLLADTLNQRLIAEGVETMEQRHAIERIGCFEMQGHLFSPPRHPNEFTQDVKQAIVEVCS